MEPTQKSRTQLRRRQRAEGYKAGFNDGTKKRLEKYQRNSCFIGGFVLGILASLAMSL